MPDKEDFKHLHLRSSAPRVDARVRRTKVALGEALVTLMEEKPFDSITVQDVLDRAHVSRATFYTHYSDKDDLLMTDAEEFFEMISNALSEHNDQSDRVFPVKEFFHHVSQMGAFVRALSTAGKVQDNWELARGQFARGIERRIAEIPRGQQVPVADRPAIAFAHAGALLSLLTWWIDRGMREKPEEMDQLFHRMVWTGLKKEE
jgi:AcrR family transcriptional regulator